jgi:ankyrin repeat protein
MKLLFKIFLCGALLSVGALQVNAMEEAVDAAADALHQALTQACRSNDETEVRALIAQGAPVNAREQDPDVTSDDQRFEEPLHVACERGYFEIARVLVENGANVWIPKSSYVTPMHLACSQGSLAIVELLIANADKNVPFDLHLGTDFITDVRDFSELTPLHCASETGHVDIMQLLIEKHIADVDLRDAFGRTPLYLSCQNNHLTAAALLVEHEADASVDAEEGFPLYFACENNNLAMVQLLLDLEEVDVNARNDFYGNNTCLHIASEHGLSDIVSLLLSRDADIYAMNDAGELPIDVATPVTRSVLSREMRWRSRVPALWLASAYADQRNIFTVLCGDLVRFTAGYM